MLVDTHQKNIAQAFILERYFFVSICPAVICIADTLQHKICISNRSKLRAERTKKSLARNSQVLSGFCYVAYTQ